MNCVLESMRKSLKTVCRQQSVALVSRIRPSSCFSISWVFDSILWEKSCRNRNSCKDKHTLRSTSFCNIVKRHCNKWSFDGTNDFTPESAANDQFALFLRISSSVQGLSHICFSSPLWLLGPFSMVSRTALKLESTHQRGYIRAAPQSPSPNTVIIWQNVCFLCKQRSLRSYVTRAVI